MTRCEQVRGELPAFIAGEPADDGWEGVRSHIGACAPCADQCASVRRVWGNMAELKFEEVRAGALDKLHARIRAEAGAGRRDWVVGLLDAAIAMGALYVLEKVVPVHLFCRLCTDVLKNTPLAAFREAGEFTAGSVLSFASLLMVLVAMRFAWQAGHPGARSVVAGVAFALLAAFVAPQLHVVVGSSVALAWWGVGAALGASLAVGVNRLVPVAVRARA